MIMSSLSVDFLKNAFDGDLDLGYAVAQSLVKNYEKLSSELNKAIQSRDRKQIKLATHAIKGALSVFGKFELYEEYKKLDESLKLSLDISDALLSDATELEKSFVIFCTNLKKIIPNSVPL